MPNFPIPKPAKYKEAGAPKPPAPIIKILDYYNLHYPSNPISYKTIYLEYLSIYSLFNFYLNKNFYSLLFVYNSLN